MQPPERKAVQRRRPRYSKRGRFWVSLLSTLAQVAAWVAFAVRGLPSLGVHLYWWATALVAALLAGWDAFTYVMGTRALDREIVSDLESMVGLEGIAAARLSPQGVVQVRGELWQAASVDGDIEKGARVRVVAQEGLKLKVKKA